GVPDLSPTDPDRVVATEQQIASVPQVAERAKTSLGDAGSDVARSAKIAFKSANSFSGGGSDVLEFTVTANTAPYGQALATAVANEYVRFRGAITTGEITRARKELLQRARELADAGQGSSTQYKDLTARADQLSTMILIGTGRARLLTPGDTAEK